MKKGIVIFMSLLFLMAVAACGNKEEAPADKDQTTDVEEAMEDDVEVENEEDPQANEETDETAESGETEQVKDCDENAATNTNGGASTSGSSAADCEEDEKTTGTNTSEAKADGWKKPDKIDNMNHLEIVHLAYDIFEAQDKRDYAFLESIAAEGTTVDRKNNKFKFENVTYPFEMEFFTKEDLGELEFRYTHEEDGVVYVGFGAIDYENESSFVVDFEFVKEGGKWKMRSMDINK